MSQERSIATEFSALRLAPLSSDEGEAYYALLDRNGGHLTQHGDDLDVMTATPETVGDELNAATDNRAMGIWLDRVLIGRVDLVPKEPGSSRSAIGSGVTSWGTGP